MNFIPSVFQNTEEFSSIDNSSSSVNIPLSTKQHPCCPSLRQTSFFLHITPEAQEKIHFYNQCLHLSIVPGGCSGLKTVFQFKDSIDVLDLNLDSTNIENNKNSPLENLLFFFPEDEKSSILFGYTANEKLLMEQPPMINSEEENNPLLAPWDKSLLKEAKVLPTSKVCLWVEAPSVSFVHGAHLDYIEEIMNQYFALYHPKAVNQCGCKSSFSL